jgi:hypothetical protein
VCDRDTKGLPSIFNVICSDENVPNLGFDLGGERGVTVFASVRNRDCLVVYCESIKRELKIKPISECRCDERLQTKSEESTCLTYTGLIGELEHRSEWTTLIFFKWLLKLIHSKTRLIDKKLKKFASVMGECVI